MLAGTRMAIIGLLGTGNVARALTTGLIRARHHVILGSRTPETPPEWTDDEAILVATFNETAQGADLVINALPGEVSLAILKQLEDALRGKILVDAANAVEIGNDGFAKALLYPGSSLAEEIQRALPATFVVKALNTMHSSLMANPTAIDGTLMAFLSGNNGDAKAQVAMLLMQLGWPDNQILDLGDITTARATETFLLLVRGAVRSLGFAPFGLSIAS